MSDKNTENKTMTLGEIEDKIIQAWAAGDKGNLGKYYESLESEPFYLKWRKTATGQASVSFKPRFISMNVAFSWIQLEMVQDVMWTKNSPVGDASTVMGVNTATEEIIILFKFDAPEAK